jgi:hypothetical protein
LAFINKLKATKINFFLQIYNGSRPFSTKIEGNFSVKPLISYFNSELEKDRILKENKDKAVVYR